MRVIKLIWRIWIKFSEVIGNLNLWIVTNLLFFTVVAIMSIPYRIFADPLRLKWARTYTWRERTRDFHTLEAMKKQG